MLFLFLIKHGFNGGFSPVYGILISKKGATYFYNSYKEFNSGNTHGARDLDYSSITEEELPSLSPQELLYWCYAHDITYEEFCKSTLLHENTHRWTLDQDMFDDPIDITIKEGMVENEARTIAYHNGIPYIPIFRNKELEIVKSILPNFTNNYITTTLIDNNTDRLILDFLRVSTHKPNYSDEYGNLSELFYNFTKAYNNQIRKLQNSESTSLLDIFDLENQLLDADSLIDSINSFSIENQAANTSPTSSTPVHPSGDDEPEL